jgi:hypothetical protein
MVLACRQNTVSCVLEAPREKMHDGIYLTNAGYEWVWNLAKNRKLCRAHCVVLFVVRDRVVASWGLSLFAAVLLLVGIK